MRNILGKCKCRSTLSLTEIDHSMLAACSELATTDLKGDQERAILANLAAIIRFIINACTSDAKDIILAIDTSQYSNIEGEDIAGQEQNLMMHQNWRPTMSNMIC
jgi:hypothetical protein